MKLGKGLFTAVVVVVGGVVEAVEWGTPRWMRQRRPRPCLRCAVRLGGQYSLYCLLTPSKFEMLDWGAEIDAQRHLHLATDRFSSCAG